MSKKKSKPAPAAPPVAQEVPPDAAAKPKPPLTVGEWIAWVVLVVSVVTGLGMTYWMSRDSF